MKVKKFKRKLSNMVEFKKFLKNPSPKIKVPLYTEIEVDQNPDNFGDGTVKNPTLNQRVGALETRFDRLDTRMDQLEDSINRLVKIVKDGFIELRKDVKDINTRLDYIVKANNLKDRK